MSELNHGSDFSCVYDLDPNFSVVSGRTCLAQAAARRLTTDPLHLFYDQNYGRNLELLLNAIVTEQVVSQVVETEILKDERVEDVDSEVTLVEPGDDGASADTVGSLSVLIDLFDGQGPFSLTLDVSQGEVTLELLEENT